VARKQLFGGCILFLMALGFQFFPDQFTGGGDRLVTWAVLLTGAVIVWCLPSEPDKK
jgi:hypothetical protein